ncbi:MAG: HDOD domain-containing protein [Candidatus Acidiferrales bacterium]
MKRILFVDNEPLAFNTLRQTLDSQRDLWEMAYAPDSETALMLLDATPFDVIVSDTRMPKMDGAALLKTVRDRFPSVVRIVLANQSEMEAALRAVPVAHQFLVKPCDPDMLRVAVERATSLSDVLNNKLLATIVGSVQDLPVLPRIYLDLRQALADPDVPLKSIVRIVEQDVGISAKILQLVNSAFFGLPREITSLQTAVSYIGMQLLQNLVLSAEVFHVFEITKPVKGFSFEEVHMHSQLTAKIAARIPASAHVHSATIIAGLLHDVGKLVLATRSPDHFARALRGAREDGVPVYAAEEALIGISHAEVGAYLLALWGLPSPVVEAVAHHHHPERIPGDLLEAVGIIHIANALANEHPVAPPIGDPLPYQFISAEYAERVGVSERIAEWQEFAAASATDLRAASPRTR